MKKVGILWDLDGTLLSTLEDLRDSVNYALAQYNCPPRTLEEIRTFIGNGARRLIRLSVPGSFTEAQVDAVLATYQAYYATHSQIKTRPYDGILEALDRLRPLFPMAIVSNKPDGATKTLCAHFFGDIPARGESTDCPRKPAPDMLYRTMGNLGVDTCIYVGDSEVDIITAHNAGVPCMSVTWGFRDEACLKENGAEHLCRDPRDLPNALTNLAKELRNG